MPCTGGPGARWVEEDGGKAHGDATASSHDHKLKGVASTNKIIPRPWWCPAGLNKTQRRRLQKLRKRELKEEKEEKVCNE
jgi:hypothetical protein